MCASAWVFSKIELDRANLEPKRACTDLRQWASVTAGAVPVFSLLWKNRVRAFQGANRRGAPTFAVGGLEAEVQTLMLWMVVGLIICGTCEGGGCWC